MSSNLANIQRIIALGEVKISSHGYDELAEDGILIRDVMAGVETAVLIEDYPDYPKGLCVLVLQRDRDNKPVHVIWGIPKGKDSPAVLVTAYRPDPERWSDDFLGRRL